jgi:hypothetical protein
MKVTMRSKFERMDHGQRRYDVPEKSGGKRGSHHKSFKYPSNLSNIHAPNVIVTTCHDNTTSKKPASAGGYSFEHFPIASSDTSDTPPSGFSPLCHAEEAIRQDNRRNRMRSRAPREGHLVSNDSKSVLPGMSPDVVHGEET